MKLDIEQLKNHIAANPPKYRYCNGDSMVEMLYGCYCESNPIDSGKIRAGFALLRQYLRDLTHDEEDLVFVTLCDLCGEHEYRAFVEGIRAAPGKMYKNVAFLLGIPTNYIFFQKRCLK